MVFLQEHKSDLTVDNLDEEIFPRRAVSVIVFVEALVTVRVQYTLWPVLSTGGGGGGTTTMLTHNLRSFV